MSLNKPLLAFASLLILTAPAAQAASSRSGLNDITYSIEPVVGYDLQRKENPDRSKLVLTYGARVIAGYKILSAEGEYLIGNSDEVFSNGNRAEEKSEKIRVGLRSTYEIGSFLDWYLRGGAEAQKVHTKSTNSGIVTESDSPSKVYPYVGTGVKIALGSTFSLNGSVTATLKDLKDMKQNEYSTTFGVSVALNTR